MRFQNVKGEELEGPIKLSGFTEWKQGLLNNGRTTSVLLAASPGAGKGAAIGALGESLQYSIVRCRLKQLLEYPDPKGEFKALLEGTEHFQRTVLWLDGLDSFLSQFPGGSREGEQILRQWLETEREPLAQNHVLVVATARKLADVSDSVTTAFDRTFSA